MYVRKYFSVILGILLVYQNVAAQQSIGTAVASDDIITVPVKTTSICPDGTETIAAYAEGFEKELVELINIERDNQGKSPLKRMTSLTTAARYHAKDMADQDYFSHNSISGCTTFDRIGAFYSYMSAGENIASGYATPESVNLGFINSPPHYSNMLNSNYREVGVGYYYNDQASGKSRWVENFGSRSGVYPVIINLEAISTDTTVVSIYAYGKDNFNEIRFRNADESWSSWLIFDKSEFNWTISGVTGVNTVYVEMKKSSVTSTSQDDIEYTGKITSIANVMPEPSLKIFPNPVSSVLKLYNPGNFKTYQIFDIHGQEIISGELSGTLNTEIIEVANLARGTYLLSVMNENVISQELFVKP